VQQQAHTASSPYEARFFREVTGLALRPGGVNLTDRALSCCGFTVGDRLLDVGCGVGASVEYLQSTYGLAVAGIDPSLTLIAEGLARNPALPLAEGNAEALPVADGELDGILCECVLSLLDQPYLALREFARAIRPGGALILSDLYLRCDAGSDRLTGLFDKASEQGLMSRDTLEVLLSASGFAICLWEDHTRQLQELAARLILAHGSLDGLWCTSRDVGCSVKRPGYYLLVARTEQTRKV
jgi:arsenite methyltransferase